MQQPKQKTFHFTIWILILVFSFVFWGCQKEEEKPEPEPTLSSVEISPGSATIVVGETTGFEAKAVSDQDTEMTDVSFTWKVKGDAVTVDNDGKVRAQSPGEAEVIVSADGKTAGAQITVNPKPVGEIKIETDKKRALAGSRIAMKIQALTSDGEPAGFHTVALSSPTTGTKITPEEIDLGSDGKGEAEVQLSENPSDNTINVNIGDITKEIKIEGTAFTKLEIEPSQQTYEAGATINFKAVGYDEYGNKKPVSAEWSLAGEAARLKEGGQVVMKQPGDISLFAKTDNLSRGLPITIVAGKPAKIELTPDQISLMAGQSKKIGVDGYNSNGYPLPVDVTWSVENELGTMSDDGSFLAEKAGKGKITAKVNGVSDEVSVTVKHGSLSEIRIKMEKTKIEAGEEVSIETVGVDAFGNEFEVDPKFSQTRTLGDFDTEKGVFKARHAGKGKLIARVENMSRETAIEVVPAKLSSIKIEPENTDVMAGKTISFTVTGYDRFGNIIDVEPEFSMSEKLGRFDKKGTFSAKKSGNTVITASVGEIKTETSLAITPAPMVEAIIQPEEHVTLEAGKTLQFKAFGKDEFGNIVETDIEWEVEPKLGKIEQNGLLSPKKAGEGMVVASIKENKTGDIFMKKTPLTVKPADPASIEINPMSADLKAGTTVDYNATVYDPYGNIVDTNVKWEVERFPVGEIDEKGNFRAVKAGEGVIRASVKNVVKDAPVSVFPAEAEYLKITNEKITIRPGEKVRLEAVTEDRFGNVIEKEISWTLTDESLGEITSDNFFIPKKEGKGRIMALSHDIADTREVTVEKGKLTKIRLQPAEATIEAGKKVDFKAVGFDLGGNRLQIEPGWFVEKELGTIDKKGVFTAEKAGSGEVVAKSGEVEKRANIRVVPSEPATVEPAMEKIEAVAGDRITIEAKVFDRFKNRITEPEFNYSISDNLGKMVEENVLLCMKAGKGELTVSSKKAKATVPLTVSHGDLDRIDVSPSFLTMVAGSGKNLKAKGFDAYDNPVSIDPKWSVTSGIGVISKTGELEARKKGQGYVSASVGDVIGVSRLTVEPGPVDSIRVIPEHKSIVAGNVAIFRATAFDKFGTETKASFKWHTPEDKPLGEFLEPGVFKAISSGSGKIAVTADKVTGTVSITVTPAEIRTIRISEPKVVIESGKTKQLEMIAYDAYKNEVPVKPRWFVDPPALAEITDDGVIRGIKKGKGTVMARAGDVEESIHLEVKPGKVDSLKIVQPTQTGYLAGNDYPFSVTPLDKGGNEVSAKVYWAVTENIGEIDRNTGVFYAKKAGTGTVVAYTGDIAKNITITVEPGKLSYIVLKPNPVTVVSNTVQRFNVSGYDVENNRVTKIPELTWNVQGGIGKFEKAGHFLATRQGEGKVTAEKGKYIAESNVTVVPGKPNPTNSRIRVKNRHVKADGENRAEIVVEVRDYYDNPVSDVEVKLVSDRPDSIQQPGRTDKSGETFGNIRSESPGTSTLKVVIDEKTLRDTATVVFEKP